MKRCLNSYSTASTIIFGRVRHTKKREAKYQLEISGCLFKPIGRRKHATKGTCCSSFIKNITRIRDFHISDSPHLLFLQAAVFTVIFVVIFILLCCFHARYQTHMSRSYSVLVNSFTLHHVKLYFKNIDVVCTDGCFMPYTQTAKVAYFFSQTFIDFYKCNCPYILAATLGDKVKTFHDFQRIIHTMHSFLSLKYYTETAEFSKDL